MKGRDVLSSIVCLVVGGAFLVGSLQQGLWLKGAVAENMPGPGFIPFIVSIVFIILSLVILISALSSKEKAVSSGSSLEEGGNEKRALIGIVALLSYVLVLDYVGYIVDTFIFMLITSRLLEPVKWRTSFIMAFATTVLSYLLFVVLMEVSLPKGLLNF